MNTFRCFTFFALLFALAQSALAQLTINVTSIPANTPDGAQIYIAGNFNGWNPGLSEYTLTPNGNGTYFISILPNVGPVEFKFTRGSWDTVEGNATGGFQENHVYNYTGGIASTDIQILSWEDLGGSNPHTAAENVQIITEDFYMPELNRYRRLWIYLPPDYETSGKDYPVLYMQDGQNLFDSYYSFAGEWEVDETLNTLFEQGDYGVVVVGIDNGGAERINEYSPWINPSYGGGNGDEYAEFLVNTLKPYIDANYRTLPEREHTGVMGSSMGALISFYTGIEYQEVFGKVGVFSPSFWFSDNCYAHVESTGMQEDMRIYLLAGGSEGFTVVPDLLMMYNTLLNNGFSADELFYLVQPDGTHSEWFWAREFEQAYQWLFNGSTVSVTANPAQSSLQVYPNPAKDVIYVELQAPVREARFQMFSLQGQLLINHTVTQSDTIDIATLASGIYLIQVVLDQNVLYTRKLAVYD